MHLGNVFCALLSWLSAKSRGGEWLLRIEDLDPQRSRREYAMQLMDDLRWLGLTWDNEPVWQSQRSDIYEHYLHRLTDMGLTYPCYCTRADIMATQAPHESDGRVVYKGTCRPKSPDSRMALPDGADQSDLSDQSDQSDQSDMSDQSDPSPRPAPPSRPAPSSNSPRPATLRLMVPDTVIPFLDGHYGRHDINLTTHCGDYIVRRRDGAWAYQLAVVVDDALMGVTEIVRGRDLLLSSPQQIHLRRLLFSGDTSDSVSGNTPSITASNPSITVPELHFFHHPLLCNAQGQRLCKRDRSLDLGYLRDRGTAPTSIIGLLAHLAGLLPEPAPVSPQDLLSVFDWAKVPTDDITMQDTAL